MPAQGNALGARDIKYMSPEGATQAACAMLCRPFRAMVSRPPFPRALPWAGMERPFRASLPGFRLTRNRKGKNTKPDETTPTSATTTLKPGAATPKSGKATLKRGETAPKPDGFTPKPDETSPKRGSLTLKPEIVTLNPGIAGLNPAHC